MSQSGRIGAFIHRIAQSSARALQIKLAPLGLTNAQFFILRCLSDEIGQTQKELADKLEIKSPSLTVMLNPLEEKGLIRREISSEDARAKLIFLTEQGKEFLQWRIQPIIRELEEKLLSGFSDHERNMLSGFLDRMCQNMKEYEIECRVARSRQDF